MSPSLAPRVSITRTSLPPMDADRGTITYLGGSTNPFETNKGTVLFSLDDDLLPQSMQEVEDQGDNHSPATRMQIDCADALQHMDKALLALAPKEEAENLLGTMYLQVAEAVQELGVKLRNISDIKVINLEILNAKARLFDRWMDGTRVSRSREWRSFRMGFSCR